MATITSLGIGSGIDINKIVEQLTALERRPLRQMQTDATRLQTQVSAYGKMQSLFGALQDASSALNNSTLWNRSVASSGDDTSVGAVGGNGAATGQYAVQVTQLAQSQTLASTSVFSAASALTGSGTMSIQLGNWSADLATFTETSGSATSEISVTSTDTLQSLRDKINASSSGVTASIVADASGARLSMRSTATGAENGFRVTTTDTDTPGLSRLAYDPAGGSTGMELKQSAANALANVNGIDVESASNQLTGAIEGLTLNLRKTTASPVNVVVSSDTESVTKNIKTFAEAYNALASFIAEQTRYDVTSKTGGPLQGDSAANQLIGRMRQVLNTPSAASNTFSRLSDVGLRLQRDGTLLVDTAKLTSATANLTELKKAFANIDTQNPGNEGFSRRYAALATSVLSVGGSLTTRNEGLRKQIAKNSEEQTKVNERAERFQQRLVAQYTVMDGNVSRLNALGSYVTQQLTAMSRQNNN